eukprot:g2971.t1
MHLYNFTLKQGSSITCSTAGSFSGPGLHEFAVARGSIAGSTLQILQPDPSTGAVRIIASQSSFGLIRSLMAFRTPGEKMDYLVVTSDSGYIVILKCTPHAHDLQRFVVVHSECFGKTGCRRIVPGQYLTADPNGRAIMIGSIEKAKLCYVMNRDASARLTISSPLVAHKNHLICHDLVGVDVGFENPVFAALEINYEDADEDATGHAAASETKQLTYYELDLGLNHVVRRWTSQTERSANLLIALPASVTAQDITGQFDPTAVQGPGGVLVCSEDFISWRNEDYGEKAIRVPIPRRADLPVTRGTLIVAGCVLKRKQLKGGFFVLLQSEYGDLYKVTVEINPKAVVSTTANGTSGNMVSEPPVFLSIQYFDTIAPSMALSIAPNGFLLAGHESGNPGLYVIVSVGTDNDPHRPLVNAHMRKNMVTINNPHNSQEIQVNLDDVNTYTHAAIRQALRNSRYGVIPTFSPQPLTNISQSESLQGLGPLLGVFRVGNVMKSHKDTTSDTVSGSKTQTNVNLNANLQLCCFGGHGSRSFVHILRRGLTCSEMANSPLPGVPTGVWTVPHQVFDSEPSKAINDGRVPVSTCRTKYIIVSFKDKTLVLKVGESVDEVKNSGLANDKPTLHVGRLGDSSLIQIHAEGIRQKPYSPESGGESGNAQGEGGTREWSTPKPAKITSCAMNSKQIVVALSDGRLISFELDSRNNLNEVERQDLGFVATSMAIGPIYNSREQIRAKYLAVADSKRNVRIFQCLTGTNGGQNGVSGFRQGGPAGGSVSGGWKQVSLQALPIRAESLCISSFKIRNNMVSQSTSNVIPRFRRALLIHIGLINGVLLRAEIDSATGALRDTRTRFLGSKPVRLQTVTMVHHEEEEEEEEEDEEESKSAESLLGTPKTVVLAISSRTWIVHVTDPHNAAFLKCSPLAYGASLEHATSFTSMECSGGIAATSGASLRIFNAEMIDGNGGQGLVGTGTTGAITRTQPLLSARVFGGKDAPSGIGNVGETGMGKGALKLAYTPRKILVHPGFNGSLWISLEADHNSQPLIGGSPELQKQETVLEGARKKSESEANNTAMQTEEDDEDEDEEEESESIAAAESRVGRLLPNGEKAGSWASCIRLIDASRALSIDDADNEEEEETKTSGPLKFPESGVLRTVQRLELGANEACFSGCLVQFFDRGGEVFLVVGVVKKYLIHPNVKGSGTQPTDENSGEIAQASSRKASARHSGCFLRVYRFLGRNSLQFLHETACGDVPLSMCEFQGRLLVGVGRTLVLYEMGKKRLLRKCETRGFANYIRTLLPAENAGNSHLGTGMVFLGDARESFSCLYYRRSDNCFVTLSEDMNVRSLTCGILVDPNTVVAGDRYGNVFALRVPKEAKNDVGVLPGSNNTGITSLWNDGAGSAGASSRNRRPGQYLQLVSHFHVGQVITSMEKTTLTPGGSECIVYSTITGAIGILYPFTNRDDIDFFSHFELFMRQEAASFVARDHLSYRSYYAPVKNVVDGDLCEQFSGLPLLTQMKVAEQLNRTPAEIVKKLDDLRNRVM